MTGEPQQPEEKNQKQQLLEMRKGEVVQHVAREERTRVTDVERRREAGVAPQGRDRDRVG